MPNRSVFSHSLPRLFTALGLAMALVTPTVVGCSSDDSAAESGSGDSGPACGNGKLEGLEECDGADFGAATCADFGFDGGSLSCGGHCAILSSSCEYYDTDGDGLTTDAETAAGTDPALADSDTDGFTDGEEVTAGTNPLSLDSWPVALQRWPNRAAQFDADGITSTGWDQGDVAKDLQLVDQYGQEFSLHQFYGYNIVLSVGARWCGPCNDAAKGSQALWTEYADKGVIFVELLLDGNVQGKDATQSDIDYWSNKYGIQFPVTWRSPGSGGSLVFAVSALPTFIFIGRDMGITEWIEGYPGDAGIQNELDSML